jgi:predicted lipoprotein
MSAAAGSEAGGRPETRRRISPRIVGIAIAALVVAAMAIDTTYKKPGETTATGRAAFDPASYGDKTFPKAVSTLEQSAVPLAKLHAALRKDQDAAGERYGKRQGSSPYSFSTTGEGVAGKAEGGLMPVQVKGLPKDVRVSLQVGPAINGTAIRDAVGFIEFGQFTNQVEYAAAATALNNKVKQEVLEGIDPKRLAGKRVSFLGAFSLVTPSVVTITPVRLEAA